MIIKSHAMAALAPVRPLRAKPATEPRSAADEEADRLRRRVGQLEVELAEREKTILALRKEIDAGILRGREEGHAAGLEAAADRQQERFDLLAEATERAVTGVREGLEDLEPTCILIARACLDTLFGDAGERGRVVYDLVRHQLAQIDRTALIRIEVSSADFPDAAALERLCDAVGLTGDMIRGLATLPSGACEMVLELGQLTLGLDQQWGAVRRKLTEMAGQGEP